MMRLGITGFPLLYTKSPRLHRGFLRAAARQGSYEVLPFDPLGGKPGFFRFLDGLRAKGYRGLNVTIPHKEWAYEYAVSRGGPPTLRSGFELVVVGTGGAARGALAGALAGHGLGARAKKISIWGRDAAKVKRLAKLVPASRRAGSRRSNGPVVVVWCLAPLDPPSARLIWNGIAGAREGRELYLYDLNYGDRSDATKDLCSRRRRRAGGGMLERQAAHSFALWAK
ncbi:MAG: hypothetical protein HY075_14610 [Deltaproteobacteria bacterium]|nr:hypothetical protein [Deltaproteobacteria bacterium]